MPGSWPSVFAGLAAGFLLAACGPSAPAPGKPDIHAAAQTEMEAAVGNLATVLVVRLARDGRPLEVNSLMPVVVAEADVHGHPAKTIFRVNERGDGLVLFSRDVPNGKSYRTELPLAELDAKREFSFTVVLPDGRLKESVFKLDRIVRQP